MPGRKIPANILRMRGSEKVNPGRYKNRGEAPVSKKEIGKAPPGLSPDVRKAWHRIVNDCPEGVLRQADRMAVERAAKQWVICESDEAQNQDRVLLLRFLGQFGMTPMDRNKIELPAPEKKNPFDADPLPKTRMVIQKGELVEKEFPARKNKFDED